MTETLKDTLKTDKKPAEKKNEAGTPQKPGTHQKKPGTQQKSDDLPPAGPHATKTNTDTDATPGAGALPDEQPGNEVDPGAG